MILETVLRNVLADAIDAEVNTGGAGDMRFETSGDVEVATIVFNATAFDAAAAGVITLQGVPLTDASATGNASPVAQASIFDGASTKQWENTVAVSGMEIDLSSLVIAAAEEVDLTSFTVTVPAS